MDNARISHNILVVDKYMKLHIKNVLKAYDVNVAEAMVLLVMYGHPETKHPPTQALGEEAGHTQEQLIDFLHYDKGVMTRTMQALEQKGYVTRQGNAADGRSFLFYKTQKAQLFKPQLMQILQNWNDAVMQGMDAATAEATALALAQMAKNAKEIAQRG